MQVPGGQKGDDGRGRLRKSAVKVGTIKLGGVWALRNAAAFDDVVRPRQLSTAANKLSRG